MQSEIYENETSKNAADNGSAAAIANGHARPRHPMEALLRVAGVVPFLKIGDLIEGTVIEKKGGKLFIDLGARGTGIVYGREYYAAEELIKGMAPEDRVSAKVVDVDNEEGYKELSLQEAGREKRWIDLKKMKEEGTALDLPVQKANTGGIILSLMGVEGFLPASQLSFKNYPRVEGGDKEKIFQELQKLVGKPLRVKILDLDPQENKLIFTEKGLGQEAIRGAIARCHVGDIVEGVITGVVDFGAFMKFYPGKLAPVKTASETAGSPQTSDAGENGRAHAQNNEESELPATGDSSGEEAVSPTDGDDGAAPESAENSLGLEGLIHLSEIDWMLVENPRELLKPGDNVRAKIIDIQGDKISLSLKQLKEDPWLRAGQSYPKGSEVRGKVTRFNPFGAFVEIERDIQGLAHISEFGTEAQMRNALKLGEEQTFTVLQVDPKEHRMSLGLVKKKEETIPPADA